MKRHFSIRKLINFICESIQMINRLHANFARKSSIIREHFKRIWGKLKYIRFYGHVLNYNRNELYIPFTERIRTSGPIRAICVANHLRKLVRIKCICLHIAMSTDSHVRNVIKNSNKVNTHTHTLSLPPFFLSDK